ncbi:MAG: hypothetical protein ISS91_03765, partial [Candidatus Omnitrophica bacterium]|nr:hypothetical protein [Candidatus Omnitrophota bacterium]
MISNKYRHRLWFKAIAAALVCLFTFNTISWSLPESTLAPYLRLAPFFEKNKLDFQDRAALICAAGELKELIASGVPRPGEIVRLNRKFQDAGLNIKIEKEITQGFIKGKDGNSGKEYVRAALCFKKTNRLIEAFFIKDHASFRPEELQELGIKEDQAHHLDCPGLEGVWFVNPVPTQESSSEEAVFKTAAPAIDPRLEQPADGDVPEEWEERARGILKNDSDHAKHMAGDEVRRLSSQIEDRLKENQPAADKRILILDDSQGFRNTLGQILEEDGNRVSSVSSLYSAKAYMERADAHGTLPDEVISDLCLGNGILGLRHSIDGLLFCLWVKKRWPGIKITLASSTFNDHRMRIFKI